jgi:DNA-binding GntR family transcriptional regulator
MTSLSQQAYQQIRRLIIEGGIGVDELLSERGLSERLGLGRTPVREALKDLERDHLVSVIPGRGAMVRQLTFQEVREIYEVRLGIEGIACYLAAERGPAPSLLKFAAVFEEHLADSSVDSSHIQEAGWHFHDAIFSAARNGQLSRLYAGVRDQIGLTLRITRDHYDTVRIRATITEHLDILAAIKARDPDLAQRVMYRHLANGLAARTRIFTRLESLLPAELLEAPRRHVESS